MKGHRRSVAAEAPERSHDRRNQHPGSPSRRTHHGHRDAQGRRHEAHDGLLPARPRPRHRGRAGRRALPRTPAEAAGPPGPGARAERARPAARPACSTPRSCSTTAPRSPRPSPLRRTARATHVHRQRRPPRQRGVLPGRPRGQRHRALWDRTRDNGRGRQPVDGIARLARASCEKPSTRTRRTVRHGRGPSSGTSTCRSATSAAAHGFYAEALGLTSWPAGTPGAVRFHRRVPPPHRDEHLEQPRRRPSPRRPSGSARSQIVVPTADDVAALTSRLAFHDRRFHSRHDGVTLRFEDPWRNRIRVAVR